MTSALDARLPHSCNFDKHDPLADDREGAERHDATSPVENIRPRNDQNASLLWGFRRAAKSGGSKRIIQKYSVQEILLVTLALRECTTVCMNALCVNALPDDLSRDVYCLFGIPIDNVGMRETVERVETAVALRNPFLIATPNVNFLVMSASDEAFRETLVFSDLCVPDGMPLVWLGRLVGVPVKKRVAGSDILEMVKRGRTKDRPLNLFLFGGADGAAEKASQAINLRGDALRGVGFVNPGFVQVEQMSGAETIAAVNASRADFLVAALGARKGQLWLHQNHARLEIPVRAHLGAVMNFYSGTVRRAPRFLQRCGLEWAWRIKEEPALWRRYVHDGFHLATLLFSRVPPLLAWSIYLRLSGQARRAKLTVTETDAIGHRVISLAGSLTSGNVEKAVAAFRVAVSDDTEVVVDLSKARAVDARFVGMFLMLEKTLRLSGRRAVFVGASRRVAFLMRLYGFPVLRAAPTPKVDRASQIAMTSAET